MTLSDVKFHPESEKNTQNGEKILEVVEIVRNMSKPQTKKHKVPGVRPRRGGRGD